MISLGKLARILVAIWLTVAVLRIASAYPFLRTWEPRAPNRLDTVRRLAVEYPQEFYNADRMDVPGHVAEQFIRRLAWVLFQEDSQWCLNGKRGTDVISRDAIAYQNSSVSFGVETFDVIAAAGGPNPQPAWQNVTRDRDEGGVGAKCITPQAVEGEPTVPPSVTLQEIADRLLSLQQTLDGLSTFVSVISVNQNHMDARLTEFLARPPVVCPPIEYPDYIARIPIRFWPDATIQIVATPKFAK